MKIGHNPATFSYLAFLRLKTAILFLTLLLASLSFAKADTGTSHNFFYRDKLDDHRYFVSRGNLVTRDGFSDLFFGYVDANIGYKLNPKWSFEAGYRQAYLKLRSGWRQEYRPHINLAYRGKMGEWVFRNRHRLEFRYFEGDANDHIRYRNESVWTAPYKVLGDSLTPYISEEFFYEFTDNDFTVNWLTFGISRSITKNTKFKLGYRLQSQKFGGVWDNRHILVSGISIINF